VIAALAAGLLALALALAGGAAGPDGGDGPDGGARGTRRGETTSSTVGREPTPPERAAGAREVVILAPEDDEFPEPVVVDGIDGRVVLRVLALGFDADRTGRIEQCVATSRGLRRCANSFPVQFDADGTARIQYLIGDRYPDPGAREPTCAPEAARCVVRLTDGDVAAVAHTGFGAPAPPSTVTITPRPDAVTPGETVAVELAGFPAGDRVRVALCAAPATAGTRRCGAPGPVAHVVVSGDGTATARLALRAEVVGSERVACGRGTPCGIVVGGRAPAGTVPVVDVTFAAGPGASYHATQVAVGIALALILLGIATVLVRTTDWRKPSEAETAAMDAAPLGGF
jgi:hypothetical protein